MRKYDDDEFALEIIVNSVVRTSTETSCRLLAPLGQSTNRLNLALATPNHAQASARGAGVAA
jgi:hypothetical protein